MYSTQTGAVHTKCQVTNMADKRLEITTNGNGGKTDVGTWIVTYNNEKLWSNNFGANVPIMFRMLLDKEGNFGIPDSSNIEQIDFMLSEMAKAKIDFFIYDMTNGGITGKIPYGWADELTKGNRWILENARITCERLALWNSTHEWKIKYAFGVGVYPAIRGNVYKDAVLIKEGYSIGEMTEMQAEPIYKEFFMHPVYGGDNYYQINGKPLLVIHDWGEDVLNVPHGFKNYKGDRTFADKFTVRNGQGGEAGTYGWVLRHGTLVHPEVELVSPGWRISAGNHDRAIGYLRENGKYYKRCWETVLENELPRMVIILTFNDFHEETAVFTADTSGCDDYYDDKWIDETGKENPSMYWDMTLDYIKKLRDKG